MTTVQAARTELEAAGVRFTRRDYMDGRVDHQSYYDQFVNDAVVGLVEERIGREKILASTDKHLNDIPLSCWDGAGASLPKARVRLVALSNMFTQAEANAIPAVSLSDRVCILKAAARRIQA